MSTTPTSPGPRQLPADEALRLYTIAETCQLLRVSRWTLYQLINRRELRTISVGSRRLVASRDLRAFVEQQREGAR